MSEENENKTPVADEVAGRIKEILFSGELSHGQKLPGENKIAERLGVGRSSVREAFPEGRRGQVAVGEPLVGR